MPAFKFLALLFFILAPTALLVGLPLLSDLHWQVIVVLLTAYYWYRAFAFIESVSSQVINTDITVTGKRKMAKQIDESKVIKTGKGPFYVVDEGKKGAYHGVWYQHKDGLWSHVCSGVDESTATGIAGALNERGLFGKMNKYSKMVTLK